MVKALVPAARGLNINREIFLDFLLTYVITEPFGAQRKFNIVILRRQFRSDYAVFKIHIHKISFLSPPLYILCHKPESLFYKLLGAERLIKPADRRRGLAFAVAEHDERRHSLLTGIRSGGGVDGRYLLAVFL